MNTLAPESQTGPPVTDYFTAADIARALTTPDRRCHTKNIKRIAVRDQWPSRFDGYRWLFAPPREIADIIVTRPQTPDVKTENPQVRFGDLSHSDAAREKVLLREKAVLTYRAHKHLGREVALQCVVAQFKLQYPALKLNCTRALRNWDKAYTQNGLDGLVEQKRGRVGRKAFVNDLEESQLLQLAADAVGHGNWKRNNPTARLNKAAAFRNLVGNPTVTGPARAWLHGARASKSSMPPSVSRAISERISPLGATLIQIGPKAAKLDGAFTECSYDDVRAGDAFTADDMTANCYVWCEWPNEQGFILIRPQILAAMDIGSMSWLSVRAVMRSKGQYTKDDVWGLVGDLFDEYGLFKMAVLEGGIWQSNIIVGHKTGLSDEVRFGGLKSLGVKLIHTRTPRGKIIETGFNQLQHAADNIRGFCGRDERKDCPEETKAALAQVRAGHAHARQYFLHIDEYTKHLAGVMRQLNSERGDGKILRGLCPADKWAQDAPTFEVLPDAAKWMYRAAYRVVEITRNGVRITVGSGKYQTAYLYADPAMEVHRGRRVIVFWNDYDPDTDAVVYSLKSGKPDKLICVAPRVQDVPRFGANPEQMAGETTRKKLAMQVARVQRETLAPYLQRNFKTPASHAKTAEVGEQITAARVEQGKRIRTRKTVRDFQGGADELLDGGASVPASRQTFSEQPIARVESGRSRVENEADPVPNLISQPGEIDLSANALLD